MPEVRCSVANCHYHGENNSCKADAIMVDINEHAGNEYNMEMGQINQFTNHHDIADNRQDTICHTFLDKNEY